MADKKYLLASCGKWERPTSSYEVRVALSAQHPRSAFFGRSNSKHATSSESGPKVQKQVAVTALHAWHSCTEAPVTSHTECPQRFEGAWLLSAGVRLDHVRAFGQKQCLGKARHQT